MKRGAFLLSITPSFLWLLLKTTICLLSKVKCNLLQYLKRCNGCTTFQKTSIPTIVYQICIVRAKKQERVTCVTLSFLIASGWAWDLSPRDPSTEPLLSSQAGQRVKRGRKPWWKPIYAKIPTFRLGLALQDGLEPTTPWLTVKKCKLLWFSKIFILLITKYLVTLR